MSGLVTKRLRDTVADSTRGTPTIREWLDRLSGVPELSQALEGVYTGESGEMRSPVTERVYLVAQWYRGKVEAAYLS